MSGEEVRLEGRELECLDGVLLRRGGHGGGTAKVVGVSSERWLGHGSCDRVSWMCPVVALRDATLYHREADVCNVAGVGGAIGAKGVESRGVEP